ncbi:MAG TPA: glycerol kinase GlpK [Treponemataceae bacterium]|nr:glycerol kinase GlpK [Treponemataceae bacterium]
MGKYILALDQGTTSSRAVIYDTNANHLYSSQKEYPQYYPKPGWVEQDAQELLESQLEVMNTVVAWAKKNLGIKPSDDIAAVGITNQRETIVLWDKNTGKPVYHAIVWQCRRTAPFCEEIVAKGLSEVIREKTGLEVDAYFSGTKIKWILDTVPGLRKRAKEGHILAGTIDSWLIWKLSGGKRHVTDYTNASRTMLYNIYVLAWDQDLLELMDIPACMLPEVCNSSEIYCHTDESICGFSAPIAAAVGDQQAALFGQGCFGCGKAKNTYGTGCFLLMNTGEKPVVSERRLLTTIAIGIDNNIEYALEGSVFMGGATIQWLRDEIGLISSAPEIDVLAESVPDTNGAYFVPAFTGLGAPYWDMYARGTLVGLTRGVKRAHICRAVIESICLQVKDVIDAMQADARQPITCLHADGGASVSNIMLQIQSDLLNVDVIRPKNVETTALGAAFLAGLAVGVWEKKEEILHFIKEDKRFKTQKKDVYRNTIYHQWMRAVERSREWVEKKDS